MMWLAKHLCAYVTLGSYYLVEISISVVSAFVLHMCESWTCVIHVGCVSDFQKKNININLSHKKKINKYFF